MMCVTISSSTQDESIQEGLDDKQSYPTFFEVLKLSRPDWMFVLLGAVFSVLIGLLFPAMAVLISRVVKVSLYSHACTQLYLASPVFQYILIGLPVTT